MARSKAGNVVITGASSGIGRGLALEYARRGWRVVGIARREGELTSLCEEILAAGGKASYLVCDVADAQAAYDAIGAAARELGSLDMVIANAGIGRQKHSARLSLDDVTRVIDVNVRGAMATLAAAIPIMFEQKSGHLVGISSLAGRRALPGGAVYSASKAALSTFLEGLRMDLGPAGIGVTDVQPGFVDTPMLSSDSPRPFRWDVATASRVIADRLESAPGLVSFPFPLAFLTRLSQYLPFGVHAFATRQFNSRGR